MMQPFPPGFSFPSATPHYANSLGKQVWTYFLSNLFHHKGASGFDKTPDIPDCFGGSRIFLEGGSRFGWYCEMPYIMTHGPGWWFQTHALYWSSRCLRRQLATVSLGEARVQKVAKLQKTRPLWMFWRILGSTVQPGGLLRFSDLVKDPQLQKNTSFEACKPSGYPLVVLNLVALSESQFFVGKPSRNGGSSTEPG